jgi:hypothetical protein
MNSIRNLKDAGGMLPAWTLPLILSLGIMGALFFAQSHLASKPHPLVSQGTLFAVAGSVIAAALLLIGSVLNAKPGHLRASISDGFIRGLNFIWSTSSVALVVYVTAAPIYALLTEHLAYSLAGAVGLAVMIAAHFVSKPKAPAAPAVDPISGIPQTTALALPAAFVPSKEQRPAFQISMADLTRLMIHQSGRLIAYKGSNCILADGFSADLDVNARTAKIFSDMNLISTKQFLYWRMHMVMMGSAAEHVVRNTTSEAALDDFQNFDELASRYMMLSDGRNTFSHPASESEAAIKATRIGMLRKQVWSRCVGACAANKGVLLDLIRLMRGQACLAYGDIKHLLDRVVMPADFPVAEFDTDDMMERALLAIEHEAPPQFEAVEHEDRADVDLHHNQQAPQHERPIEAESGQGEPTAKLYRFNA